MLMAGRMGISEELVTPYLNIHVHEIKATEESDIDMKEIDEYWDF